MNILETLAEEHRIFRRLLERLAKSVTLEESAARKEIQNTLLLLFPVLDAHEKIETIVFDPAHLDQGAKCQGFFQKVSHQHEQIHKLRKEVLDMRGNSRKRSFEDLKMGALELIGLLNYHFELEERELWPEYSQFLRSTAAHSIGRRVTQKLKEMELELGKRWELVEGLLAS